MPVQRGAIKMGVYIVLQSARGQDAGIAIDANSIYPTTVALSGVGPSLTSSGAPIAKYWPSLHNLAMQFPAPYRTVNSRMVRVAGSYRVSGVKRYACFVSVLLPTCPEASSSKSV